MFSVVIPLYNKEKYISRTIRSVLAQTFDDFEVIIVDDGSTDGSVCEAQKFDDPRIRIIHQKNAGVSVARNRGIEEAKFDHVAFLDADDEWLPDFLDTICRLKKNFPECSLFATNYFFCEESGVTKTTKINNVTTLPLEKVLNDYFSVAAISDPPLWTSAVVVEKKALERIGGFPPGIKVGEDLLTWARLALRVKIAYSAVPKAIFHLRSSVHGYPMRLPDLPDKVGFFLEEMMTEVSPQQLPAFKKYLGLWYRMRASVFLRAGKISEGRCELKKMAKFAEKDLRFFVYFFIALSPMFLSKLLMRTFVLIKKIKRNK